MGREVGVEPRPRQVCHYPQGSFGAAAGLVAWYAWRHAELPVPTGEPSRLAATGYAEFQPRVQNSDELARATFKYSIVYLAALFSAMGIFGGYLVGVVLIGATALAGLMPNATTSAPAKSSSSTTRASSPPASSATNPSPSTSSTSAPSRSWSMSS